MILLALFLLGSLAPLLQAQRTSAAGTVITSLDGQYVATLAPSPDDRWLAFDVAGSDAHLFVAPLDGGSPRVLVPGDASLPVWFRDGTRLAYYSDQLPGIVVTDFDPDAGIIVGAPRRVTLEPARSFDVSPDGEWIAYATPARRAHNVIRLAPARGGPAWTLVDAPGLAELPRFSRDGRHVYFTRYALPTGRFEVQRVAIDDGTLDVVRSRPHVGDMTMMAEPRTQRIVERVNETIVVVTFAGDTVARVDAGDNFTAEANFAMRLSADGGSLLVSSTDIGASIRAYPVNGGGARQLSDARAYNWPVGWSVDGERVFFEDSTTVWSMRLDGQGEPQPTQFDPVNPVVDRRTVSIHAVSGDGRYWLVSRRERAPRPLFIYDTRTRALRQITPTGGAGSVRGPGGAYLAWHPESGEFMYSEGRGDSVEMRAVKPEGTSRLVRAFARGERRGAPSVHGNRVAWITRADSSVILVATGEGAPRAVWKSKERVDDVVWSHDGRSMAVLLDVSRRGGGGRLALAFLEVQPDGTFRETARTRPIAAAWDVFWMPDDSAVLFIELRGSRDSRVVRVPAHTSGPFTYVVPQGAGTFWDQFLSPRGTHVVVPMEQYRGSSILRIDLPAGAPKR